VDTSSQVLSKFNLEVVLVLVLYKLKFFMSSDIFI
jgi:hypothetical protein